MSATAASPSPDDGKRDDQTFNEGDTPGASALIDTGSSAKTAAAQDGPLNKNEDLQQSEMGTDAAPEGQAPAGSSTVTATASATAPSQQDSLARQMDGFAVSAKSTSDSPPASATDTPPPPPPPEKDDTYLKPTSTPPAPASQSGFESNSGPSSEKDLPDVPGESDPESRQGGQTDGARDDNDSQSEIQSIMGQFQDPRRSTGQDEIMSPRLELAEQFRGAQNYFPPHKSSLDHMKSSEPGSSTSPESHVMPTPAQHHHHYEQPVLTRQSSASTVPPPPEPEPDQPFDFHRFLEQLRHRTADPVAKFLRSFLMEFGKRQWMVHEQVKIISDFLAFITNKMALCEVWRDVSDSEFDNAKEGMEKLVMNRLYSQTFSPAIPAPPTIPRSASRSRRRELERLHGPWRRGQHQEDIERDDILAQKIRIYGWVSEEHLDIPPVSGGGRRFLNLAQHGTSDTCPSREQSLTRT